MTILHTMGRIDGRGTLFIYRYEDCKIGQHSSLLTFNNNIETRIMKELWKIKPGDVVIDAGASFGLYTLPAILMGAQKVYAFEPHPQFYNSFRNNLELNNIVDKCELYQLGLANQEAELQFNLDDLTCFTGNPNSSIKVARLDKVVEEMIKIDRLDFIKIDVEGAELDVLEGAVNTINKFHPKLLIETHDSIKPHITDGVLEFLEKRYSIQVETINFERIYLLITFV